MFFPGREGQRMRGYPGGGVLVFPVLLPGDHLHLAVNCLATVFSYLPQFPHSTCQGIFLASHYPVLAPALWTSNLPGIWRFVFVEHVVYAEHVLLLFLSDLNLPN